MTADEIDRPSRERATTMGSTMGGYTAVESNEDAVRSDLADLQAWGFASPGPLRDELTALALAGTKVTTAGLLVETELENEVVPAPGMREVLLDSDERPVAVIETVSCRVARLADVDDRHAIDEGEGYANEHEFRVAHERFWNAYLDDLRDQLGDPTFTIDDDTLVVLQRFRIVERLDPVAGGFRDA
jgi:uncharacterized protein YhfF